MVIHSKKKSKKKLCSIKNDRIIHSIQKLNPFELQSNKKSMKHEVLGRRIKGAQRNVALARAQGEVRRAKTLKQEFIQREKKNVFKDKRLGEKNDDLSLEDKMLLRFQQERKKKKNIKKSNIYNLNENDHLLYNLDKELDNPNDDDLLTHNGTKISDYNNLQDDFNTLFELNKENDDKIIKNKEKRLDEEIVNRLHFGGGELDEKKKKSHREIMQEVIMKSKLFKAERQQAKENQDDLTNKLDSEFYEFASLLSFRPKKGVKNYNKEMDEVKQEDDYDKITREFIYEEKVKAMDRKLTPEEIAKKEQDKLILLEKKRLKRMKGEDTDSENEEENKKKNSKNKKKNNNIIFPPTDDDIITDYQINDSFQDFNDNLDEKSQDEETESVDNEEESEYDEDDYDSETSTEEEDEIESEKEPLNDEMNEKEKTVENKIELQKLHQSDIQNQNDELPYIFDCPKTLKELNDIFTKYNTNVEKRIIIIDRINKYYSIKLAEENKIKMKDFLTVLIHYFNKLCSNYQKHKSEIDKLSEQIINISKELNQIGGIIFRDYLISIRKKIHANQVVRKWPEITDLFLFKLITKIYPCSDLRHNIISPLEIIISQCLEEAPIKSLQDLKQGLFCCALSLDISKSKEKFSPEVIRFFIRTLNCFFNNMSSKTKSFQPGNELNLFLNENNNNDLENESNLLNIFSLTNKELTIYQILISLLHLIFECVNLYKHVPSFAEIFSFIEQMLQKYINERIMKDSEHPIQIKHKNLIEKVLTEIKTNTNECLKNRFPLRLQISAPKVLKTYAPKFDLNYTIHKDLSTDKEKSKLRQLKRQVKRERKGAARELRRDAEYIQKEKLKENIEINNEKREKQKNIQAWLQQEQATFNQQVKKGGELLKGGGSGKAKKRKIN